MDITLTLTIDEIRTILHGLDQMAHGAVRILVDKIVDSFNVQLAQMQTSQGVAEISETVKAESTKVKAKIKDAKEGAPGHA